LEDGFAALFWTSRSKAARKNATRCAFAAVIVVAPLCSESSGARRRYVLGVPEQGAKAFPEQRRAGVQLLWDGFAALFWTSWSKAARKNAMFCISPPSSSSRRFAPGIPEQSAALFREFRSNARKRCLAPEVSPSRRFGVKLLFFDVGYLGAAATARAVHRPRSARTARTARNRAHSARTACTPRFPLPAHRFPRPAPRFSHPAR